MSAQTKRAALTEDETDQIREYADRPPERVKLYVKFIDERVATLRTAVSEATAKKRPLRADQNEQLHNLMDEFTRLVDEMQDNLDNYADQHNDIRKALKGLIEADAHWQEALKLPPPNPSYEFVRKTAQNAATDTADAAQKILDEQTQYFKDKKKSTKD